MCIRDSYKRSMADDSKKYGQPAALSDAGKRNNDSDARQAHGFIYIRKLRQKYNPGRDSRFRQRQQKRVQPLLQKIFRRNTVSVSQRTPHRTRVAAASHNIGSCKKHLPFLRLRRCRLLYTPLQKNKRRNTRSIQKKPPCHTIKYNRAVSLPTAAVTG